MIQIQIQIRFRFRFRFRLILFCQHTTFSNSNEIIKYADMEAPIKTISGRYHRTTREINYTDHSEFTYTKGM